MLPWGALESHLLLCGGLSHLQTAHERTLKCDRGVNGLVREWVLDISYKPGRHGHLRCVHTLLALKHRVFRTTLEFSLRVGNLMLSLPITESIECQHGTFGCENL